MFVYNRFLMIGSIMYELGGDCTSYTRCIKFLTNFFLFARWRWYAVFDDLSRLFIY